MITLGWVGSAAGLRSDVRVHFLESWSFPTTCHRLGPKKLGLRRLDLGLAASMLCMECMVVNFFTTWQKWNAGHKVQECCPQAFLVPRATLWRISGLNIWCGDARVVLTRHTTIWGYSQCGWWKLRPPGHNHHHHCPKLICLKNAYYSYQLIYYIFYPWHAVPAGNLIILK